MSAAPEIDILLWRLEQGEDSHNPDSQWVACKKLLEKLEGASPEPEIRNRIKNILLVELDKPPRCALVRTYGILMLGILNASEEASRIISYLKDNYEINRSYAAKVLGELGLDNAVPYLLDTIINDDFFGVRAEAASSITKICEKSQGMECQKVRDALPMLKQIEKQRPIPPGQKDRVLRELDNAERVVGAKQVIG